jgi:hypothetical protein
MSVYTVHAPPTAGATPDPERFVFVRDGFHFWAFVFGPLWLLGKGLWLALVIYVAVVAALQAGLWLIAAPPAAHTLLTVLVHFLIGLEACTIQRWTFKQRGWTSLGLVTALNREAAEQRFFDRWVTDRARSRNTPAPPTLPPRPTPPPPPPPPRPLEPPSDIIGLFPQPQSRP